MSTENMEANVADKLDQALRDLLGVSYNYGVSDSQGLIDAQEHHIRRLQEKLSARRPI